MTKIVIADDHQIVLDGLCSILHRDESIEVVGTATTSRGLIQLLENNPVEIAILDIEMPDQNGIELTRHVQIKFPDVKVILLTMYKTPHMVNKAIEAGAMGYLLKERGKEELVRAIQTVSTGETYLGEGVVNLLLEGLRSPQKPQSQDNPVPITNREKEVLSLIVKGQSVKQIAKQLFIAPTTVESHKKNLFAKTGVNNVKELIAYAYQHDLGA